MICILCYIIPLWWMEAKNVLMGGLDYSDEVKMYLISTNVEVLMRVFDGWSANDDVAWKQYWQLIECFYSQRDKIIMTYMLIKLIYNHIKRFPHCVIDKRMFCFGMFEKTLYIFLKKIPKRTVSVNCSVLNRWYL